MSNWKSLVVVLCIVFAVLLGYSIWERNRPVTNMDALRLYFTTGKAAAEEALELAKPALTEKEIQEVEHALSKIEMNYDGDTPLTITHRIVSLYEWSKFGRNKNRETDERYKLLINLDWAVNQAAMFPHMPGTRPEETEYSKAHENYEAARGCLLDQIEVSRKYRARNVPE